MGKVIVQQSMSLDGYSAGLNTGINHPLGERGERLHEWMSNASDAEINQAMFAETLHAPGAFILGKTMFDIGIHFWDEGTFTAPCFVLAHKPHEIVVAKSGHFTFVTDGVVQALASAKSVASERPVIVIGGATVIQQFIKARLVDELRIALVPILLGQGIRLFDQLGTDMVDLEVMKVVSGVGATHLYYRFAK